MSIRMSIRISSETLYDCIHSKTLPKAVDALATTEGAVKDLAGSLHLVIESAEYKKYFSKQTERRKAVLCLLNSLVQPLSEYSSQLRSMSSLMLSTLSQLTVTKETLEPHPSDIYYGVFAKVRFKLL